MVKTNTLYVSGLDPSIDEAKLRVEFAKHGSVERGELIKNFGIAKLRLL